MRFSLPLVRELIVGIFEGFTNIWSVPHSFRGKLLKGTLDVSSINKRDILSFYMTSI